VVTLKGLIFPMYPQRFSSSSSLRFLILISCVRKIIPTCLWSTDFSNLTYLASIV